MKNQFDHFAGAAMRKLDKKQRRANAIKKYQTLALLLGWTFDDRTKRWCLDNDPPGGLKRRAESPRQAVYFSTHRTRKGRR